MTTKKETRGRKRKFDLDVALAEAQRQFHQDGYEGAKLGEICAALGITQTSLYAAYGNKIGLYRSVVDRYAHTSVSFIGDALESAKTPEQVWTGVLFGAAETYGKPGATGCLVLGTDVATTNRQAKEILADQVVKTQRVIEDRLRALGATDAGGDARTIIMILRGLSGAARAGIGSEDLRQDVERLLSAGPIRSSE
ncbi:TetR/AcrR family transcriptional regulator [Algihabitans albus]|uniref:TetR/AcrR family transcriptional regulator n=1 Tax=Algihabitans albus TaxID=2164067 RepID=UPI000E5D10B9|nr:TetR/AcrR family transcriptional regulator [Algihabitans albus]